MSYYIPQWEERTSYGFRRIDPYTKLFEDRIIMLGTPISDDVANAVMAQLMSLQAMDPDRDIMGAIGLAGPYDFLPLHDPELEIIFAPAGNLRPSATAGSMATGGSASVA